MYSALWKHTATTPTTHTKRQNDAMGHDVSGETILSTILILFALATLAVIGRFYTRFVLWRDGGVEYGNHDDHTHRSTDTIPSSATGSSSPP